MYTTRSIQADKSGDIMGGHKIAIGPSTSSVPIAPWVYRPPQSKNSCTVLPLGIRVAKRAKPPKQLDAIEDRGRVGEYLRDAMINEMQ